MKLIQRNLGIEGTGHWSTVQETANSTTNRICRQGKEGDGQGKTRQATCSVCHFAQTFLQPDNSIQVVFHTLWQNSHITVDFSPLVVCRFCFFIFMLLIYGDIISLNMVALYNHIIIMEGNINCNTHAPEQELKCLPTDKQGRQKPFPPTQFYKDGPSPWTWL